MGRVPIPLTAAAAPPVRRGPITGVRRVRATATVPPLPVTITGAIITHDPIVRIIRAADRAIMGTAPGMTGRATIVPGIPATTGRVDRAESTVPDGRGTIIIPVVRIPDHRMLPPVPRLLSAEHTVPARVPRTWSLRVGLIAP